jgi:nucleotide-binding universal stress UspA family protein
MKHLLCAVDFSDFSKGVLQFGTEFAERSGAKLLVFHSVFSPQDQLYGSTLFERGGEQEKKKSEALETIGKLMAGVSINWEPVITAGDPVTEVVRVGHQWKIDLVIAASHGLSGFKRLFLGTVVERIANTLPYPLMVIRSPRASNGSLRKDHPSVQLREIAICCGFSSEIASLVKFGVGMAQLWKASLTLLHSIEAPSEQSYLQHGCGSYRYIQQNMQDRLSEQLLEVIPDPLRREIPCRAVILQGVPGEQIVHYTRKNRPDLLIVGIRRHSPIGKFIVGTTTRDLVRHAPGSVLTVPTPAEKMELK